MIPPAGSVAAHGRWESWPIHAVRFSAIATARRNRVTCPRTSRGRRALSYTKRVDLDLMSIAPAKPRLITREREWSLLEALLCEIFTCGAKSVLISATMVRYRTNERMSQNQNAYKTESMKISRTNQYLPLGIHTSNTHLRSPSSLRLRSQPSNERSICRAASEAPIHGHLACGRLFVCQNHRTCHC